MVYLLVIIHLICDKILINQKHVELKTSKPEYLLIHAIFYSFAISSFKYGLTFNFKDSIIVFILIFIFRIIFDNILSEILQSYKNKMITGTIAPNLGYDSFNVITSFILFLISYTIFNYAI